MAGYDGSLKFDTEISEKGFNSGITKLGSLAKGGFKVLSAAVAGVTASMGAASGAVIKIGSDFESQMSRVKAISGATGEEFEQLRQQALDLGADTAFSASEAANGMENLAAAGFSTNEIMSAMPGMLNLAAASGEDLASSADIAASTLRGFGLEASEAAHVADVLAENANRTNSSVADTGEAMKYIAPLARAAGISLEETAAAIGIMANAGIQGSQAGTTLRGALSRLSSPTDDMIQAMDELGISFYDSEGKMLSLSDQVGMLQAAMSGLTDEQKNNYLVTLYGQESLSGMLALINEGPDSLSQLTQSFQACDGAAEKAASTMQDNLQGAVEQLKGSAETLGITIYDSVSDGLKGLAQLGTDAINQLTSAFQTQGVEGLIQAGSQILVNLLTGIAQGLPNVITTALQIIQALITNLNSNLPQLISAGGQILMSLVQGIVSLLPSLGELALNIILSLANAISANAPQMIPKAAEVLLNFVQGIISNLPQIVDAGINMLISLAMGVANALPQLIEKVPQIINQFCSEIDSLLPKILAAGVGIIVILGMGIIQSIPTIIANAGEIVKAILNVITHLNLFSTGANIIKGLGNGIKSLFGSIGSTVKSLITKIKNPFNIDWASIGRNIVNGIANGIRNFAGSIVSAAKSAAKKALNAAKSFLGIHSPSRVFRDQVGKYMALGMGVGFEENVPTDDMTGSIAGAVGQMQKKVTSITSHPATVTGYPLNPGKGISKENPDPFDYERMGKAVADALDGTAVNMDGDKVGDIITQRVDSNMGRKMVMIERGG